MDELQKTKFKGNIFAGIDPGFTGWITAINEDGSLHSFIKTPIFTDVKKVKRRATGKISTSTKTSLDEPAIIEILRSFPNYSVVALEKQHPVTGQGLASTGKTMYGYGFWVGVTRSLGLNLKLITAKEWQKVMLDNSIEDTKEASVAAVKKWNKELDLRKTKRSKKDDHNLADSINIARYCWQSFSKA